ncbi:MAG: phosphate signaling complex protein PhoU [Ignavibacteria bacterium]|jgi:phosphate transport system protein|nr:phosphate signaling complex protein PhoU [Ignavibacteria bacterium]MDH7526979.1 phosphate signaling complex protein PhoU [Ignavibacteria bacterium]
MHKHFETELESLKTNITKMASLVDEMVEEAFIALKESNIELCKKIKARDREIDAYDNLIKTQCENILALFQPFAIDLRFILTALMVNNQLERCGDIAVNITQRVKPLMDYKFLLEESKVFEMGEFAKQMFKDAIDSFINRDSKLAEQIGDKDNIVDSYNKNIFRFLVDKMKTNNELIEPASHLMILSRHIERLADHSTNIAEDVIFMVNAEIVSHKHKLGHQ